MTLLDQENQLSRFSSQRSGLGLILAASLLSFSSETVAQQSRQEIRRQGEGVAQGVEASGATKNNPQTQQNYNNAANFIRAFATFQSANAPSEQQSSTVINNTIVNSQSQAAQPQQRLISAMVYRSGMFIPTMIQDISGDHKYNSSFLIDKGEKITSVDQILTHAKVLKVSTSDLIARNKILCLSSSLDNTFDQDLYLFHNVFMENGELVANSLVPALVKAKTCITTVTYWDPKDDFENYVFKVGGRPGKLFFVPSYGPSPEQSNNEAKTFYYPRHLIEVTH